ncbi:MAG: hypothetical protein AAGA75_23240 [Cyanobacteria bacterium P01_E01_bin.6]
MTKFHSGCWVYIYSVVTRKAALDLDKMPAVAIAPWPGPNSAESDRRKRTLSYAILAPNPHTMQLWLVELKTSILWATSDYI